MDAESGRVITHESHGFNEGYKLRFELLADELVEVKEVESKQIAFTPKGFQQTELSLWLPMWL